MGKSCRNISKYEPARSPSEAVADLLKHSVIPEKKLRFALTARYIKPEYVDESEWKKGEFSLSSDQIYDGK
jgi:hypothetical protein